MTPRFEAFIHTTSHFNPFSHTHTTSQYIVLIAFFALLRSSSFGVHILEMSRRDIRETRRIYPRSFFFFVHSEWHRMESIMASPIGFFFFFFFFLFFFFTRHDTLLH
ncbi:hypothetical protein GGR53DRAFT_394917 [Hypoxylon sp. FL1150]|nr:hypothetical protein GGR53DRAFT_394917 [Hypoxylon sp. FL1150]